MNRKLMEKFKAGNLIITTDGKGHELRNALMKDGLRMYSSGSHLKESLCYDGYDVMGNSTEVAKMYHETAEVVSANEFLKEEKMNVLEQFKRGDLVITECTSECKELLGKMGFKTRGGLNVSKSMLGRRYVGCNYKTGEYGIPSGGGSKFENHPNQITSEAFIKAVKNLDETSIPEMGIKKVIKNEPAVIVILEDGTKGVAVCGKKDTFDLEVGFALAYTRAIYKRAGLDSIPVKGEK